MSICLHLLLEVYKLCKVWLLIPLYNITLKKILVKRMTSTLIVKVFTYLHFWSDTRKTCISYLFELLNKFPTGKEHV